jgi:hypothetical protein
MITRQKALALRRMIEKAAISLPDEDALEAVELFPEWAANTEYERLIRVRYGDKLYRCEQAHTSQVGWTPDLTPALWTEVAKPGEIPVWRQPTGAQDAYRIGDKVHYPDEDGPVYICTMDYNTYAPDVYGWELE